MDYPRTDQEFDAWFPTDEACARYLRTLRWPMGFKCPTCGSIAGWVTARGTVRCSACHRQTSATAGTLFHGTRAPLRTFFRAIWYVTSQKAGVSALGLQRALGLGSYQTAWAWLHKLRRAMVRPGRDLLTGEVEVDETYLGGAEVGVMGRRHGRKAIVAVAAEVRGSGIGRIRLARVADASASSLLPFVQATVVSGATVLTDGWSGYSGLNQLGYYHRPKPVSRSAEPAHALMPRVHRVATLLDRWWLGTHHGAVSHRHLDYYLDEFTFRFNRRTSSARGLLFYRLVSQALQHEPVPFARLVGGATGPDTTSSG